MDDRDTYTKFFIASATAEGYHRTAEMIRQQIRDGFEFIIKFSGPYVINLSFACELYMKALLLLNGISFPKGQNGHNFKELYQRLPESDRETIEKKFGTAPCVFHFIDTHPKIFTDYRYPYERKDEKKAICLKELESFADILGAICLKRQEESNHAD